MILVWIKLRIFKLETDLKSVLCIVYVSWCSFVASQIRLIFWIESFRICSYKWFKNQIQWKLDHLTHNATDKQTFKTYFSLLISFYQSLRKINENNTDGLKNWILSVPRTHATTNVDITKGRMANANKRSWWYSNRNASQSSTYLLNFYCSISNIF